MNICLKADANFAKSISDLGSIRFGDGTYLILKATEVSKKKLPVISNYWELIRDCVSAGVNSVDDLNAKECPETGELSTE